MIDFTNQITSFLLGGSVAPALEVSRQGTQV
jgi:hypothetical protein